MLSNRLLILPILVFFSANSFATSAPKFDPIYKPNLHNIIKLPTKKTLFGAFKKREAEAINVGEELKQYFSKFDFDYRSNQVNNKLTTRNVGVHYSLNSSIFTSIHVNTSEHMLNRQEMSVTPGIGIGFYLNKRKKKIVQLSGNPYFAKRIH